MSRTSWLSPRQSLFRLPHISLKIISRQSQPRSQRRWGVFVCVAFFLVERNFSVSRENKQSSCTCVVGSHYFIIFQSGTWSERRIVILQPNETPQSKDQTHPKSNVLIRCEKKWAGKNGIRRRTHLFCSVSYETQFIHLMHIKYVGLLTSFALRAFCTSIPFSLDFMYLFSHGFKVPHARAILFHILFSSHFKQLFILCFFSFFFVVVEANKHALFN